MEKHRVNRFRRVAISALGLTAVILAAFGTADAVAAPVAAKQADSFVESVGVNVHLTYSDTPYAEFTRLNQALQELGVRYIRDGVGLGRPDVYAEYRALAAEGIHLDMIVGDPLQRYGIGTLSQQFSMIEKEFPEAVATLEGPNEFDEQGDPNWIADLKNYQRAIWEGVKQHPVLASKPILGPSLVYAESRAELGNISQWTDQGNMHPYPGGQMPDSNSHAESEFSLASGVTGSQPVEATETGYQNGVHNTTAGNRPVSEKAAGIYTPRLFLDNFRRGVVRTFDYELIDSEPDPSLTNEGDFGLMKSDWTPKPAYTALQRLINLTADPGPTFTPEPLDFTLQNAPSTARQVLLERRDGSYDLMLWNAVSVWNTNSLTEINPASSAVQVHFEQPLEKVEMFQPSESATAVSSASNVSTLSLSLSPSVTVIHVVPVNARPPASGGPEPLEQNPEALASGSGSSTSTQSTTETTSGRKATSPSASGDKPSGAKASGETAAPVSTAPNAERRSVRAKVRVIRRRVNSGCTRGCPLHGVELTKARELLGARWAKGSASTRRNVQVASWLIQRRAALAGEGHLKGRRLLRYLTIELVLKTARHGRHG